MLYREYQLSAPLSAFVQALWYTSGYNPEHRRERVLPNGCMQILINLRNDQITHSDRRCNEPSSLPPAVLAGLQSEYTIIDTSDLQEMIGVQFWPGGLSAFTHVPADQFVDAHVPLCDVWEGRAQELRERLLAAADLRTRFRLLEQALLLRLKHTSQHLAVDFALRCFRDSAGDRRVAEVTEMTGLSARRFAQVFREHVGVTPKLYCRILRFQQAIRCANAGKEVDWADVALSCGYFDQSHFVNEFRAFSGITPGGYSASRAEWMNHVRI